MLTVVHNDSDLISGLIALMESNVTVPVNLGNPEERTMLKFATIVQQLTGKWAVSQSVGAGAMTQAECIDSQASDVFNFMVESLLLHYLIVED